jgi:hypothetical protein
VTLRLSTAASRLASSRDRGPGIWPASLGGSEVFSDTARL